MRRRQFISTVSSSLGGLLLATHSGQGFAARSSDQCRPTPRQTTGPFLTPNSARRTDIREASPGVPLQITLNVVDDIHCKPIKGAVVDVWHTDASGLYSGVRNGFSRRQFDGQTNGQSGDMRGRSFLRGQQISDQNGRVQFTTIFPGWYPGRLAHIHLRTLVGGSLGSVHTTQLYLPVEVERAVYQSGAYKPRGQNPIGTERDIVVRGNAQTLQQLTLSLSGGLEGLHGTFDLAVPS